MSLITIIFQSLVLIFCLNISYSQEQYIEAQKLLEKDDPSNLRDIQLKLELSCHQGYIPSFTTLASLHMSKEANHPSVTTGGMNHQQVAFYLYMIAGSSGNGEAQFNLGIFYKNGIEIKQDHEKAYFWLFLASKNHSDLGDMAQDAKRYADEVGKLLSFDVRKSVEENAMKTLVSGRSLNVSRYFLDYLLPNGAESILNSANETMQNRIIRKAMLAFNLGDIKEAHSLFKESQCLITSQQH